jgi:hypothetical protein
VHNSGRPDNILGPIINELLVSMKRLPDNQVVLFEQNYPPAWPLQFFFEKRLLSSCMA